MAAEQTSLTMLDQALALARQGFNVFPVIEGGKIPAIEKWQLRATTDADQIVKWWTNRPNNNVGICTTRFRDGHLLVLDADAKDDGPATVADLEFVYEGFTQTRRVATPSGGFHLYYTSDKPLSTTAKRVGPGVDTRGVNGYVVAPGSVAGGKAYVLQGGDIEPIPEWLAERVGRAVKREQQENVFTLLDMQPAIDRAIAYLKENAPSCVEGSRGSTAYRVAAKIREFGVSELSARDLMVEHWNEDHCSPPMEFEDLTTSVDHAYRYAKEAVGSASPMMDFDPVPDTDQQAGEKPKSKLTYERPKDIRLSFEHVGLIDDWIDQQAFVVMYGDSNVGKTFVAVDQAFHVATGRPWNGLKVTKGVVVYVAAEAGGSARKRIEALKRRHDLEDFDVVLVPCPVDLRSPAGDTKGLVELIREVEAQWGKVVMVVIDTLSRAMAGGNENGPEDMGALVKNVDRIRVACSAAVMLIHHTGKDAAKGARGHSLLRAATDTEIEVERGTIRATKQRDMEMGKPVSFGLVSVELGRRADGKVVTSATVELGVGRGVDFDALELTGQERLALECLVEAMAGRESATSEEWLDCFEERYVMEVEAKPRDKLWHLLRTYRASLRKKAAIEETQRNQWIAVAMGI